MVTRKTFGELTNKELLSILKLRQEVFVIEQEIYVVDIDGNDEISTHYFIMENNEVVSCARVFKERGEVHAGRIVTGKIHRGKGYSTQIMRQILSEFGKVVISSQIPVRPFYEKLGFKRVGRIYFEAGLKHQKMIYEKPRD